MNKTLATVALLALAGSLAACSSPGTDIAGNSVKAAATSAPADTTTSDTPSDTTTDSPTADGPKQFAIGDTATVTQDGQDAGSIVVSNVTVATKPATQFGSNPKNGRFKLVTVTMRDIGTQTWDVNPFDFYLRTADGTKYQPGDGNAIGAFDTEDFNATTLNPKEQVKGTITFDAPAGATELVYAPQSQSLGVWTIK